MPIILCLAPCGRRTGKERGLAPRRNNLGAEEPSSAPFAMQGKSHCSVALVRCDWISTHVKYMRLVRVGEWDGTC